jgi:hypothetical protein
MVTSTSIGKGGLGRFGNQLYTIAGVIGIATKSGQPYGFPKWRNYDNALFGDEVTDFGEWFVNPLPEDRGLQFQEYGYFWGYRDIILPHGNWSINAHLQSPKFFEHCIETVRHYFRMKDEPEQNDYCAIHYRAGDYIDNPDAYHPRCSKEYYEKAIAMMPEGTKYMVFSDDYEAVERVFGVGFIRDIKRTYLEDFRLMKKCKHFISSNSTFSAMAATLGEHPDKIVIAPKRWFGTQAGDMNWNDGYDKKWIVI